MRKTTLSTAIGVVSAAVVLIAPAALADGNGGSVNGTVSIALRSITVDLSSADFANCYDSYGELASGVIAHGPTAAGPVNALLPGGLCLSPLVTLTNGDVPGDVDVVQGDGTAGSSDATGVDGTGTWALEDADDTNPFPAGPGENAYQAATVSVQSNVPRSSPGTDAWAPLTSGISSTPTCDTVFDQPFGADYRNGSYHCHADAGQVGTEKLAIQGPSSFSATETATQYSFTTTWLAVPSQ